MEKLCQRSIDEKRENVGFCCIQLIEKRRGQPSINWIVHTFDGPDGSSLLKSSSLNGLDKWSGNGQFIQCFLVKGE